MSIGIRCLLYSPLVVLLHPGQLTFGDEVRESELTINEKAVIREIVYEGSLDVGVEETGGPLISPRKLIVPPGLSELYQEKPIAVMRLLLAICEGARPEDAHRAYCFATSLHINAVAGALVSIRDLDRNYDRITEGELPLYPHPPLRNQQVTKLQKALGKLRAEQSDRDPQDTNEPSLESATDSHSQE